MLYWRTLETCDLHHKLIKKLFTEIINKVRISVIFFDYNLWIRPLLAIRKNAGLRHFRIGFTFHSRRLCPLLLYSPCLKRTIKKSFTLCFRSSIMSACFPPLRLVIISNLSVLILQIFALSLFGTSADEHIGIVHLSLTQTPGAAFDFVFELVLPMVLLW